MTDRSRFSRALFCGQPELRKTRSAWLSASLFLLSVSVAPAHAQVNPTSNAQTSGDTSGTTPSTTPRSRSLANAPSSSTPQELSDRKSNTFADWLEARTDTLGAGPKPTEPELRRIFFDAVRTAADRSPQAKEAQANYQATLSDVNQAKGERWPQVDVGTTSQSLQGGVPVNTTPRQGNQLSLNVTTNLFDWGRIENNIGSREQSANAAQQAYQAVLETSAFEVTSTLVELGKQRLVVELSGQFLDRMERLVAMLREIVAVDPGRNSELTQAKSRVLQAQAQRDSAKMRVRDAELNLRKLVGEYHVVMLPRTSAWPLQPAELGALLSEVEQHPSVAQAQATAKAAELQAATVKAASRPAVNWVISANAARDVSGGSQQPWQTNLTANWPLFRGGSAEAAYKGALSRADASRELIEQQRRDLTYGVRAADQDARTLLERADLYVDLSVETDKVRRAFFEQWYHLGRRTLLDVLTAETEHYGNRVNEVTTRFDGYLAVFQEYSQAGILSRWLEYGS